jgi:hypothetical protein
MTEIQVTDFQCKKKSDCTPDVWGKHFWFTLHYISLGYPDTPTNLQKEQYKTFFTYLQYVLPCAICSEHYNNNLQKIPLTDEILSNKDKFIKWVIDLHNKVNEVTNKPIVNYDDALKLLNNYNMDFNIDYTKKHYCNYNLVSFAIIVTLIIICIIIYYRNSEFKKL